MNVPAIPLLYVFEADEDAWLELESYLAELRDWWQDDRTEGGRIVDLYKRLYKIFNSKWRDLRYPIDSAGDPPWVRDPDSVKAKATERERRRLRQSNCRLCRQQARRHTPNVVSRIPPGLPPRN